MRPGIPKDSGWSWMVLLATTIEMTLVVGTQKSAGILFVAFQDRFQSSSAMTSSLSTTQHFIYCFSAVFVMTVGVKLVSCRTLVTAGSIINCLAYIVTSQATDIKILLVSYGVLHGIGNALVLGPSVSMVGYYFEKRRGFANSISISGASIGGLVFAPILTQLFGYYGYRGCLLILAGFMLNGCIGGVLMRPTYYYENKRGNLLSEVDEEQNTDRRNTLNNDSPAVSNKSIEENLSGNDIKSKINENKQTIAKGIVPYKHEIKLGIQSEEWYRDRSYSDSVFKKPSVKRGLKSGDEQGISNCNAVSQSNPQLSHSDNIIWEKGILSGKMLILSTGDMFGSFVRIDDATDTASSDISIANKRNMCSIFLDMFDTDVLKMPSFICFEIAAVMLCPATIISTIFIAPYAKEKSLSAIEVANLVTVVSSVDLVSRIFVAFISDRNWIRRSSMIGIASLVIGVSAFLLQFFQTYESLLGFSVVLGTVCGTYYSLYAVVIVDYLGLDRLNAVLGFSSLFSGSATALIFYFVGYLQDVTGSYITSYYLLGALTLLGTVFMFLLPVVQRKCDL
ncbi:uncharacterized protein LOC128218981 [Mya arenaria]|uniref:uncharacterized protein LOC128218981 n=1 Tax=Mya arenaria TaxID=6604 RepID=UPI0022E048CD|nr:uncharacterized protein LOC128218981 [Mya arenaria]